MYIQKYYILFIEVGELYIYTVFLITKYIQIIHCVIENNI